jgi:hypothetical protein
MLPNLKMCHMQIIKNTVLGFFRKIWETERKIKEAERQKLRVDEQILKNIRPEILLLSNLNR